MGTALALRLLDAGQQVRVWNRTGANAFEAREAGAVWASTPRQLTKDSQAVISFLFDSQAVTEGSPRLGTLQNAGQAFFVGRTVLPRRYTFQLSYKF